MSIATPARPTPWLPAAAGGGPSRRSSSDRHTWAALTICRRLIGPDSSQPCSPCEDTDAPGQPPAEPRCPDGCQRRRSAGAERANLRAALNSAAWSGFMSYLLGSFARWCSRSCCGTLSLRQPRRRACRGGRGAEASSARSSAASPSCSSRRFGQLTGQMLASVAYDHFGWLGLTQRTLDLARLIGVGLLVPQSVIRWNWSTLRWFSSGAAASLHNDISACETRIRGTVRPSTSSARGRRGPALLRAHVAFSETGLGR